MNQFCGLTLLDRPVGPCGYMAVGSWGREAVWPWRRTSTMSLLSHYVLLLLYSPFVIILLSHAIIL